MRKIKTSAVILAGGEGSRLGVLTAKRTKPAVPFGGKYRIIDFALSNCVNSGLSDVMILAQYRPHSLIEHVGAGGPWDLNRERWGGVRIYSPYRSREDANWFVGTADAVQRNFLFIKDRRPDVVVILSGDHIYRMNYGQMIESHVKSGAAVTLATIEVSREDAPRFGIVSSDADGWATSFVEKPADPPPGLGNMGVYVFSYDVLDRVLREDHLRSDSSHDFGKDILPKMIADGEKVFTWLYKGYWRDVGTLESYWEAHMDLITSPPAYDLNDLGWLIHTRSEDRAPARIRQSKLSNCLISHGCEIGEDAVIENSILAPGVRIAPGVVIRNSVLLNDCVVPEGCVVQRAILDKYVTLGRNNQIGAEGGKLSIVGKGSALPDDLKVLAGGAIGPDVSPEEITVGQVDEGELVNTNRAPWEISQARH